MHEQSSTVELHCKDQYPLGLSVFPSEGSKGVVIIASAVGVPQQFYRRYAQFLSDQGYTAITFDYRGTGQSICREKKRNVNLEDWGAKDIAAVIDYAATLVEEHTLPSDIFYVGHSIGGQVVGLADNAHRLKAMIMVASSAPYWQRWSFPNNLKMWLTGRMIIPVIALGKSEFPAKSIGLGNMNLPTPAVRQWAKWMNRPDYLFCESFQLNTSNYDRLSLPVLSLGFGDDILAPEENIRTLLDYFPNAQSEVRIVDPKEVSQSSIGHSGFFRDKFENTLWQDSIAWFQQL